MSEQSSNRIALLCVAVWLALSLAGAALVHDLDTQTVTILFQD